MNQILSLLTATALCALFSACASNVTPTSQQSAAHPTIVVQPPRGEPADFVVCDDGNVLVFATSHPRSCS